MFIFMISGAVLGLGLGGLIRAIVNHWSSYIIAAVVGPAFGVLLASVMTLLVPGGGQQVLDIGQGVWAGLLFTLIGVRMFTPNRHWIEKPDPERAGSRFDPWQSGA